MSVMKIRIALILIILLGIGCLFVVDFIGVIRPGEMNTASVGSPVLIVRDDDFLSTGITQIVSDENNLYVLFGAYSVVQVYTLDGSYQYSIAVKYDYPNGRTQIAADNNSLYICDKQDNIYIFEDGAFVQYLDRSEADDLRKKINFWHSDPQYQVRGGSIWYASEDAEEYCVLQRPAWLAVYQNGVSWTVKFVLAVIVGVLLFLSNFKKKTAAAAGEAAP